MASSINVSNYPNKTIVFEDFNWHTIIFVVHVIETCISIVATILNLWFLAAILRSPELRSYLRNKIICSSFVVHLINCMVLLPIYLGIYYANTGVHCVVNAIVLNSYLIVNLISNWLLVMLIAVFIAQIADFKPTTRLSPRTITFCTVGLLAFPWLAGMIIVPVVIHAHRKSNPDGYGDCFSASRDSYDVFRFIDTVLPIILALVLVTAAAFLRYRRFTVRRSAGSIQFELMERGPEIDNILVYIIAVIVSILCDLLILIVVLDRDIDSRLGLKATMYLEATSVVLADSRYVLMPLVWFIFPDIRNRIRTWRPWYPPAPDVDLTVTYHKEET